MGVSLREYFGSAASEDHGSALALSGDGGILAVGIARLSNYYNGVYIYDWSGSAWVKRGSKILGSDTVNADGFGYSVALSGDGSVLVVGSRWWEGSFTDQGGVYVYDWSGSAWVQRGSVIEASDAAASAHFGSGVALSADGTVLVVGAQQRTGTLSQQGGAYIYDWSGSAWVQRGSVLLAGDAAASDWFGSSVALSSDGETLVVGAMQWEGGASNQGGAYIYDWSGSAWVQRGSVLTASDAGASDYFGRSVAISGDGIKIAVGAYRWDESGGTDNGAAYYFEWDGAAWDEIATLRHHVYLSGDIFDSSSYDYGGEAVALSRDGYVLSVGTPWWTNAALNRYGAVATFAITDTGTPGAPTELTLEPSLGTLSAATDLTVYAEGAAEASTELTIEPALGYAVASTSLLVANVGEVSAPTELTVQWPSGTVSAATALTMTTTGESSAATLLAVLGSAHAPNWAARCVVGGVDLSAWLVGEATVEAEEGAARIARVVLQPDSGTIAPLDYVGKSITLDYVLVIGGVDVPRRMFTGLVDTPAYDPVTTLLTLDCVDDLQNRVALLDRSVIDGLVGGRYSTAVQGELDDNWDYAQALLSTVPASLDAGPSGGMRVTPWEIAAAWATLGEPSLIYREAGLTLPQRSTMVNRVEVAFDYRYARLRQRYTSIGWSGTQADMVKTGYAYPKQQDIRGAAGGSGWTIVAEAYWPAPASIPHPSGGFVYPDEGSIDMAVLFLAQRHAQTVTEKFTITVNAPESQALNGDLPASIRGALASSFNGANWESALDIEPLLAGGTEQDYAPDATRADAEHAIQTLLDQAKARILGSHRGARVRNAVLCNPDLDLDKRITIDTTGVQAGGKVARVLHRLDFEGGSAITEFDLAIFGAGGAGIITPDTLEPPEPPQESAATHVWQAEVPSLTVSVYGSTSYTESLMGLLLNPPETITVENVPGEGTVTYDNPYYVAGEGYPVTGFRVRMPGVDDGDRNPLQKTTNQAYDLVIPSDTLTFTVP